MELLDAAATAKAQMILLMFQLEVPVTAMNADNAEAQKHVAGAQAQLHRCHRDMEAHAAIAGQ